MFNVFNLYYSFFSFRSLSVGLYYKYNSMFFVYEGLSFLYVFCALSQRNIRRVITNKLGVNVVEFHTFHFVLQAYCYVSRKSQYFYQRLGGLQCSVLSERP